MFERFTDRARRALVLAQEEACLLGHSFIGTEHILLGLIHEGEGLAAQTLESLGMSIESVRDHVREMVGPATTTSSDKRPFTPRAKKVLELSLREALQLGHNYIGTEHILLGLLREGEGVAAKSLETLGATLPAVREKVLSLLSGYQPGGRDSRPGPRRISDPMSRRHPKRLLQGSETRLISKSIEFRVVGALSFDDGLQLFWRLSGVPEPLADLLQNTSATRFDSQPLRALFELTDDLDTPYIAESGSFQPQPNGEWAGEFSFKPAIPDDAQLLKFEWQGEVLNLEL